MDGAGDVGGKGAVAALVARDLDVVDPHSRPVVHRAEMEEQPFGRRGVEAPAIPDHVAHPLADPRQLGLRTERHLDPPVELRPLARAEFPLAVEARPRLSPEAGPGVQGPGSHASPPPNRRLGERSLPAHNTRSVRVRRPTRHVSVKDVAARSGVSFQTTSKVLNGGGSVSEATRARIIRAASDIGYVPNLQARSLVMQRTRTIGLITGDFSDPGLSRCLAGAEQEARRQGYGLMLTSVEPEGSGTEYALPAMMERRVDGILLAAPQMEEDSAPRDRKTAAGGVLGGRVRRPGQRRVHNAPVDDRARAVLRDRRRGDAPPSQARRRRPPEDDHGRAAGAPDHARIDSARFVSSRPRASSSPSRSPENLTRRKTPRRRRRGFRHR